MEDKCYCLCGCEEEVKPGNKFVYKHNRRGQKLSEETKIKLSLANSGENNYLFGKHHSEETKAKLSGENNSNW